MSDLEKRDLVTLTAQKSFVESVVTLQVVKGRGSGQRPSAEITA